MKKFYFSIFSFFILIINYSQAPEISLDKTYGGSDIEYPGRSTTKTNDGGLLITGPSRSNISGNKSENSKGGADYWVIKTNSQGNIEWQKTIGGSQDDYLTSAISTSDGGYLLGGYSNSNISGDKTENEISGFGSSDYWIVKLSSSGIIEWEETIGGNVDDILVDIIESVNGGYLLAGYSNSMMSGDKTENRIGLGDDYWVVKIDGLGNVLWDNTIGGSIQQRLYTIKETSDFGFILGGNSKSDASADKTENSRGGNDYWFVKLNSSGVVQWDKTIGGENEDWLRSLTIAEDGGFILAGFSSSNISGDKTENSKGGDDYWIVKLTSSGIIEWQKTIGSSGIGGDLLTSIVKTIDNGYILCGYSSSDSSGDKTENSKGGVDFWIVKINSSGEIEWDKTIGGIEVDIPYIILRNDDNSYSIIGFSQSDISGDKTENSYGGSDIWMVKLESETLSTLNTFNNKGISIHPNPVQEILELESSLNIESIRLFSINGKLIKEFGAFETTYLNVSDLASGIYIIEITSEKTKTTKKFIKE